MTLARSRATERRAQQFFVDLDAHYDRPRRRRDSRGRRITAPERASLRCDATGISIAGHPFLEASARRTRARDRVSQDALIRRQAHADKHVQLSDSEQ
jgi:hypothetical protein